MSFLNIFKKKLAEKGIPEDKAEKIVDETQRYNEKSKEDYLNMIEEELEQESLQLQLIPNQNIDIKKFKSQRRLAIALELYRKVIIYNPEFLGELKNQLEFILKSINSDLNKQMEEKNNENK